MSHPVTQSHRLLLTCIVLQSLNTSHARMNHPSWMWCPFASRAHSLRCCCCCCVLGSAAPSGGQPPPLHQPHFKDDVRRPRGGNKCQSSGRKEGSESDYLNRTVPTLKRHLTSVIPFNTVNTIPTAERRCCSVDACAYVTQNKARAQGPEQAYR